MGRGGLRERSLADKTDGFGSGPDLKNLGNFGFFFFFFFFFCCCCFCFCCFVVVFFFLKMVSLGSPGLTVGVVWSCSRRKVGSFVAAQPRKWGGGTLPRHIPVLA